MNLGEVLFGGFGNKNTGSIFILMRWRSFVSWCNTNIDVIPFWKFMPPLNIKIGVSYCFITD